MVDAARPGKIHMYRPVRLHVPAVSPITRQILRIIWSRCFVERYSTCRDVKNKFRHRRSAGRLPSTCFDFSERVQIINSAGRWYRPMDTFLFLNECLFRKPP